GGNPERAGLRDWDFGPLPEALGVARDGLRVRAYPGLVDEGDSAALRLFDTPAAAAAATRLGLLRLAAITLADTVKYLRKELFRGSVLPLAAAGFADRSTLVEDAIAAALQEALFAAAPAPRDAAAFAACVARGRGEVVAVAQRLAAQVLDWSDSLRALRLLLGERAARFPEAVAEGRAQLEFLLRPGFLRDTEPHWREQYPRYLQAA